MTTKTTENNGDMRYFFTTALIIFGFFVAYLPKTSISNWQLVLFISMGHGFSIYGCIWLSWALFEFINKKKDLSLNFLSSILISLSGLIPGAFLGVIVRAKILGIEKIDFTGVPEIVLIGIFITLVFHFWEKSKNQEQDNFELKLINEKLQEVREKKYLENISCKIGNENKILDVNEIEFFVSENHCTIAIIQNKEYIIDYSIKKLAEDLNPEKFVQIHRNSIIRVDQIKSIRNGNNWLLETVSGKELSISRSNRSKIKELFL